MTNKEAIEILKEYEAVDDSLKWYMSGYSEAFDMAIKALEQSEPCNDDKGCSNCMYSGRPTYKSPCSECRDNSQWEMKPISRSHENSTECEDTISRQAAIDALAKHEKSNGHNYTLFVDIVSECAEIIRDLPSVQPELSEITDVQAILHLQSTGWMQNHDREIYESGLREQLADDSGSYGSLIPSEDTISRTEAIDDLHGRDPSQIWDTADIEVWVNALPSAQPEQHWIPVSERMPEDGEKCLVSVRCSNNFLIDRGTYSTDLFKVDEEHFFGKRGESGWYYLSSEYGYCKILNVIAWMPLPEPYRACRKENR